MKKLFYIGLGALALFEILNVYFIMPMPGSQQLNTIDLAYFLYQHRWYFRISFTLIALLGSFHAFTSSKKWIPSVCLMATLVIVYLFNFKMNAEKMFLQPETLVFKSRSENKLSDSTVVLAVELKGFSKAYPLRYIVYHHQVRDSLAEIPIMVTYCSVCRTGRAFNPEVNGKPENFRLVGMDHFNAMFEDETTHSWWRQVNGEAITGPLKGYALEEIESNQFTLSKFFSLYPFGQVMQPEENSIPQYDTLGKFEWGKSKSKLTGTDSVSWNEKSWVLGLLEGDEAKAYDWNLLKEKKLIHDQFNGKPVLIVLSDDGQSFAAYIRNSQNDQFTLRQDTLIVGDKRFGFSGINVDNPTESLKKISAYQEFWHSWRTFHPQTERFTQ